MALAYRVFARQAPRAARALSARAALCPAVHSSSGHPGAQDFGKGFKAPHLKEKLLLECLNEHPLDKDVSFDSKTHTYSFCAQPLKCSVTELVKHYFDDFDAQVVVDRMMQSKNWPRVGYIHQDGEPFTRSEVLNAWEDVGLQARNRGTWMHHNIERLLNNVAISDDELAAWAEYPQVTAFRREVLQSQGIDTFRTEWRIAAPDLSLGGSVDFVGQRRGAGGEDEFVLMDWKRSRRLSEQVAAACGPKRKASRFLKFGRNPLGHLEDNDLSKYCLQLNVYGHILRRYYGLHVTDSFLVSFAPDAQHYCLHQVPRMDMDVEAILDDLRQRVGV